ncbi:hypothetical protein N0V90_000355 [Kalmusia sp. IMI 367209]|nr:hypothetical protein N0V90_000355 [Kalmusia sp. IMI 367209]
MNVAYDRKRQFQEQAETTDRDIRIEFSIRAIEVACPALHDHLCRYKTIHGSEKFYYFYIYCTMSKLGMGHFAKVLCPFLVRSVSESGLVDEPWALKFLLDHHRDEEDALLLAAAKRYVNLNAAGQMPLSAEQSAVIVR